jgi:hypothetical protein
VQLIIVNLRKKNYKGMNLHVINVYARFILGNKFPNVNEGFNKRGMITSDTITHYGFFDRSKKQVLSFWTTIVTT